MGQSVITHAQGNLLAADVEALVNTVNTVGVMGKGVALQFKRAYPDMFKDYAKQAMAGALRIGRMHVWRTDELVPRWIINFPTKQHWRNPSEMDFIDEGLTDLVRVVRELGIASIAVPPLGCGNGGLDWAEVEPRIARAFEELPGVAVKLYPPAGAPPAVSMVTRTTRPALSRGRAALITLLADYSDRAAGASLVEVQKLVYLLQAAGEPLHLDFVKARYGPYSDHLRRQLVSMEGHYLTGFGDGNSKVLESEPIRVLDGVDKLASRELATMPATIEHVERVLDLVAGYESAYGMELLASVHWVMQESPNARTDPDAAAEMVRAWSVRKCGMFTDHHVRAAWGALHRHGWAGSRMADAQ